jgi:hypothetical protein
MATFTTDTLIRVVERLPRPAAYLLNTFFPDIITSETETVSFDLDDGKRRITPLVSPLMPGKVVETPAIQTGTLRPPYAKDKRRFEWWKAFRRRAGETIGNTALMSPAERREAKLAEYAADGVEMLTRRKSVMAAEALRTGKVTLSGEGFKTVVVDFGRPAGNTITLAGANRWNQALTGGAPNPLGDLETWSGLVEGGGTTVVMAPDTWAAMRARMIERGEDISLLGTIRGGTSALDMGPQSTQDSRVNVIGNIGRFSIVTYDETYVDDAGVEQRLIPTGELVMASPDVLLGAQLHGAILDAAAGFRAMEYFPKVYAENDPPVEWWLLQSAPIVVPFRPKASLGVKTFG